MDIIGYAQVVELVYTPVLGTGGAIRGGSSPLLGTMKKYIVTKEDAGMRLDKFLTFSFAKASEDKGEFFLLSRGEIIRKIKSKDITVNGKIEKASYLIKEADVIEAKLENVKNGLVSDEHVKLDIIFENDDFLVINKQAGIQVHPSASMRSGTITNVLVTKYPEIVNVHDGSKDSELRPGIVHRLDRDTSGVMVVAKKIESFLQLKKMFANRKVKKTYLAITIGLFSKKSGIIKVSIAKSADYRKQVVARLNTKTRIREAITEYRVLDEGKENSLVEAKPKTGRMHQIRVHLASTGHPILGDKLYGSNKAKNVDIGRQMLHAYVLEFEYLGRKYTFKANVPEDMKKVWSSIDGLI